MSDPSIHRPHHDEHNLPGEYFITGKMTDGLSLMVDTEYKYEFFEVLINLCKRHKLDLIAWVLMDNHYHVMVCSEKIFQLSRFANSLHSVTAKIFNDNDQVRGRQVWNQYWDRRIRDEKESWMSFNYIHWNPIKHGAVCDLLGASNYEFNSMGLWIDRLGQEAIEIFYEQYPTDQFNPNE